MVEEEEDRGLETSDLSVKLLLFFVSQVYFVKKCSPTKTKCMMLIIKQFVI